MKRIFNLATVIVLLGAIQVNGQSVTYDFQDGTDQGFGTGFGNDASASFPIVNIGDATLSAIPGKRWQVVLYLDNNSANTVVPLINCRFTNAGKLVEQTHVLVPAVGAGLRVGMIVNGPKTDLFVDRAKCSVTSP
jgi:hypothetical protein